MDVREKLLEAAENGRYFEINLRNKRLKIGKEVIIEDGKLKDGYKMCLLSEPPTDQIYQLEDLYKAYKYSVPSERSEQRSKRCYFVALRPDQLSDTELITGENRLTAKAKLEYHVLNMIMSGTKWSDIDKLHSNHWYWQSKDPYAKELILLKEWFA